MSNFVSNADAATLFEAVGKKKLTVTDTMPTAAEANVGVSYLYLGADTQDFEEGGVYKCQEITPATDPKTYEYIHIFTAKVDLSLYKRIFGGTVDAWDLLTDEQKAQYEYTFFDGDSNDYFAVVDAVTDGDMHPVTSNAVAEEIDAIDAETSDIVNIYGSKNLLLFDIENIKAVNYSGTWNGNSYTYLGITYTLVLNDDGTLAYVEANGTANTNAQAQFHFMRESLGKKVYMPEGHILMSGCPSGGSDSRFSQVLYYDGAWYVDTGLSSGKDIAIVDPTKAVDFYINIKNGTTVDHQRYYPMLRRSSIKDGSYVPYAMTNKEITDAINTVKTITPTFTGATFLDGAITQNNKHISMNIRVKLKSDLAANSSVQLATDMPLPKGYVPFFAVVQSATNQNMAFIDTAGNLTFHTYIALSTAPIIALSVGYDIA